MVITQNHIYQVSKLFYAIAISDARLHEIEKGMVIRSMTEYSKLLGSLDPSVRNHYVNPSEILQAIDQENSTAWGLFDGFEKYYRENKAEFSEEIRKWIIANANEIASSYARQNKSEIVLIARIRLLFKNN